MTTLNVELVDDWWEIIDNTSGEFDEYYANWNIRTNWCDSIFSRDNWSWSWASDNEYGQRDPGTWLFKNEKDAVMFVLRWS